MIKKINILLVLVATFFSVSIAITKENNLVFVLKDISIILTINALYIIQRIFKVKISESLNFFYILFIFCAHFLGVNCNLYGRIYFYDKLTHFVSGILTSFGAIYILIKSKNNKNLAFNILFIITLSLAVAAFWEIFEYNASYYFNVDPQRVKATGVTDTMQDIMVAFLGSILVSIPYYFEHKYKSNMLIKKFEEKV